METNEINENKNLKTKELQIFKKRLKKIKQELKKVHKQDEKIVNNPDIINDYSLIAIQLELEKEKIEYELKNMETIKQKDENKSLKTKELQILKKMMKLRKKNKIQ